MITAWRYLPGELFPVNTIGLMGRDRLLSRNERLVSFIDTPEGRIAMVKVGATSVGRIVTTYLDLVTNRPRAWPRHGILGQPVPIRRGQEIGRFEFGSSVVLLFERGRAEPTGPAAGDPTDARLARDAQIAQEHQQP